MNSNSDPSSAAADGAPPPLAGGGDQAEIRFLVEKNADGIIVVDEDGIVLLANPATAQIFGRPPASLIGSPVGIPLVAGETTEIVIHRPGGDQVNAEIRVVDANWGGRPARLASLRDVSARKAIEERLRHAAKMEAVGRLTAGIAHDFNNLLTVVLGNLDHARRLNQDATLHALLGNAARGAARAAELTERLLSFARRKPLEPKALNVNALVSAMSDLLRRTLGERVAIRVGLGADLWQVEADPAELEAAIVNLAVNARDAMPAGGEVTIETANIELDAAYASREAEVRPGPYVLISVADTGIGMSREALGQVFEPFFTTKADGRGTGLGLSQVYGFVKQSGGHVKLYSEPGIGTTAKIYLPKADAQGAAAQQSAPPTSDSQIPVSRSGETILVVEDDEDVRKYAASCLRQLNYAVLEAADVPSAIRILESNSEIRLLFSDFGLPGGMDGRDLANRARQIRDGVKVLITTAYPGGALVREGRLDRGVELLAKPFTFASLARRVRDLLDRQEPSSPRVLVVDDEALLRMVLIDSLVEEGFVAEEAANFEEAACKTRGFGDRLAAAIIDIGLPDRPGDELVSEIRALRPDLPIILATGYADEDLRRRFAADAQVEILAKPFDPRSLVAKLRALGVRKAAGSSDPPLSTPRSARQEEGA